MEWKSTCANAPNAIRLKTVNNRIVRHRQVVSQGTGTLTRTPPVYVCSTFSKKWLVARLQHAQSSRKGSSAGFRRHRQVSPSWSRTWAHFAAHEQPSGRTWQARASDSESSRAEGVATAGIGADGPKCSGTRGLVSLDPFGRPGGLFSALCGRLGSRCAVILAQLFPHQMSRIAFSLTLYFLATANLVTREMYPWADALDSLNWKISMTSEGTRTVFFLRANICSDESS
jgi:hypothetical protein